MFLFRIIGALRIILRHGALVECRIRHGLDPTVDWIGSDWAWWVWPSFL